MNDELLSSILCSDAFSLVTLSYQSKAEWFVDSLMPHVYLLSFSGTISSDSDLHAVCFSPLLLPEPAVWFTFRKRVMQCCCSLGSCPSDSDPEVYSNGVKPGFTHLDFSAWCLLHFVFNRLSSCDFVPNRLYFSCNAFGYFNKLVQTWIRI